MPLDQRVDRISLSNYRTQMRGTFWRSIGKAIGVGLETVEFVEGLPGMGANEARGG